MLQVPLSSFSLSDLTFLSSATSSVSFSFSFFFFKIELISQGFVKIYVGQPEGVSARKTSIRQKATWPASDSVPRK